MATISDDRFRPPTPASECKDALSARIETLVAAAATTLKRDLDRPNLTLRIGGNLVMNGTAPATGFKEVTGLTQPSLTSEQREARLQALIQTKTTLLISRLDGLIASTTAPHPIHPDFAAFIGSFGVPIAANHGDPGFSPAAMKTASEDLLRERIKEETARIIRQKFNEVAATVDLSTPTTPLPPPPNLTPLVEANERLLQEQRETREQQRRQFAEQRAQQQRPDTDEQAQAKQIQGKIKELLKPGQRLSKKEIYEWIEESVALARDDGRLLKKLEHTGLVKYDIRPSFDPDTGERTADRVRVYPGATKSSYFMNLRVKSFAAWGVTMAVSAGLVELGNTVSGGGVAVALGMASAVNGVNLVVQWYLEKKHNDTFKNTWVEIQNELGTMDPKRAPALAGIMFLLVDKYSPLMWHRDRTQFWLPGQPSSVTAVLDHLKEAAAAALNNVRGTSEGYYKGVDVKEKVALAKTGLENLTKRWAGHWLTSSWWSTTLTCGSLLGSLGLAVGTLS